jgi:hypothetical protein
MIYYIRLMLLAIFILSPVMAEESIQFRTPAAKTLTHYSIKTKKTNIKAAKRFVKTSDKFNQITEYIEEIWSNNKWRNYTKGTRHSDKNDHLVEEYIYDWNSDDSVWVSFGRYEYAYDDKNYLQETTYMFWQDSTYTNFDKTLFTYDSSSGVLLEQLYSRWVDGEWLKDWKEIYQFDPDGLETGGAYYEWRDGEWQIYTEWTNTHHDSTGLLLKWQSIDFIEGDTLNAHKDTLIYENGILAEEILQQWVNDRWLNSDRWLDTYDEAINHTEDVHQIWENNQWQDYHKWSRTFDDDGLLTGELFEIYHGSDWQNGHKWTFYYDNEQSRVRQPADEHRAPEQFKLTNYPNPFNAQTTITFRLKKASATMLKIYDIRGSLVKTLLRSENLNAGTHEIRWNGRDSQSKAVPTGIYLYRLQAGPHIISGKCSLIR